jgi:anti-sigma factor RsiW
LAAEETARGNAVRSQQPAEVGVAFGHRHLDDETLERYVLGRLTEPDLADAEEHLLVCEECRRSLAGVQSFINAVRGAGEDLLESWVFSHHTEEGPVRLEVTRAGRQQWVGRYRGASVEGRGVFAGARAAYEFVERSFTQLFPEHRCNELCGRGP